MSARRTPVVAALGAAQLVAWGSSYYLPAVLATPMARDLNLPAPMVFAAFSLALIASGIVGPVAGRIIDRWGGRTTLMLTNVAFAAGLVALGFAQGTLSLFVAWALIGIAMGGGLYDAAFATVVRLYGNDSRDPITGITLIAGFASTVAWPLTAMLEANIGWRETCWAWAASHLLLALPLNATLPRVAPVSLSQSSCEVKPAGHAPTTVHGNVLTAALLSYVFAVTWFIATAMAAHLPRMLEAVGTSLAVAVGVSTLVGPAQVAGRLFEFGFLRHVSPLVSARLACLAHPVGALVLLAFGAPLAAAFTILHGIGIGILTISKGTLPLLIFGPEGYGARQGWLALPSRITTAIAPLAFGVALERLGGNAVWVTAALAITAVMALLLIRMPRR